MTMVTLPDGSVVPANDPRVIVVQQPTPPPPPVNEPPTFTMDEVIARVEAARTEEKDKLYSTLNTMDERLKIFEAERQALVDQAQAEAEALAEAQRLAQQQEMTITERQQQLEAQWEERFQAQEQKMAADQALFQKEREFQQIAGYRNQRLAEMADQIDPRFADFVGGTTPEEIEASLFIAATKTAEIGGEFQKYLQEQGFVPGQALPPPRTPGLPVTSGPGYTPDQWGQQLTNQETTLTADDIKNMNMADFAQNREALLDAASRQVREKGLYG